jgi:DNA-binding MarR family transcriptional regulator
VLTSIRRANAAGKLTEEQVIEIRELYKNGSLQKELQEKFKLSQSQISGIVTYKSWKFVT